MPEAPEVQTVLSTLEHQISSLEIREVKIFYDKLVSNIDVYSFCEKLKGQTFRRFYRIGKYLGFEMDTYDWIVHLRMEGKFYLYESLPECKKHIHAIFFLSDGRYLCYHDTRKFGRMELYPKTENKASLPAFKNVGLDALDDQVTGLYFYHHIHTKKISLKAALLDQSIMAGVGNIYADEICYASGLDPRSRCSRITKKEAENIVEQTKRILKGAIKAGGTTIRSYTSSLGVTGRFQLKLKVHAKEGEPCPTCQKPIIKIKVSQRGTYLCPNCQKRK